MTQKILEKRKKYQNPKKTEICSNERETPPTLERAKRADQHVYASARKIKKTNIMTLKTPKNQILNVIRSPSHSHFVLAAFKHSNSPFGLVFVLKRRPSVRPPASLWDVTPQKNASFPNIFNSVGAFSRIQVPNVKTYVFLRYKFRDFKFRT